MPPRAIRVRFAPVKTGPVAAAPSLGLLNASSFNDTQASEPAGRRAPRSRTGCGQCKVRKVKCDETFPVCLRCQKGGLLCNSTPPSSGWQLELPWVFAHTLSDSTRQNTDSSLMQWWFDKACNILVADTSANPLSYPILEHIASSSALLHALQSISSGHRQYFDRSCFPKCLQQRSMALSQVRRELQETNASPVASFFSIMMLGMSAPWIDGSFRDTGIEHFIGARAVLDTILSKRSNWKDHAVQVIMGFYLFWDMAISLVAEPALLPRLNTPEIIDMVAEMDGYSHPIGGFPIRVFYLLARIHRYYREIMEGLARDLAFEFDMEDQLSGWQCSSENEHFELLANAFRTQGLMVLYRAKSLLVLPGFDDENLEAKISDYAHRTVVQLLQTPVTQHCFNMQAPPLTLTAAELTAEHAKERVDVVGRLRAIYSLSRVATILAAIELLEELWAMRDAGVKITYFELMEWKGWKLNLV